jgi:ATP-binding cassette subfamily B protein
MGREVQHRVRRSSAGIPDAEHRRLRMARFLYGNLRGQRLLVSLAACMTLVQVGADILVAFPIKFVLDKIVHHLDPTVPLIGGLLSSFDQLGTRNGLNDNEIHTQMGVIAFSAALLLVFSTVSAVLSYLQVLIAASVGSKLGAQLRSRLFEHVQSLSLDWHGRQRTGDLVQRITGNVADIEKLVTDGLVDLLGGVLTLVGALLVMTLLSWQFTVVCMLVVPGLFMVVARYTIAIKWAARHRAKAAGQVAEVATEDIGAITEVKAFTLEEREALHFRRYSQGLWAASWRVGRLQAELTPIVAVLIAVASVSIIGIGGWIAAGHGHSFGLGPLTIADGTLTVGSLTVFLTYSKQLYQPMRSLSKLMNLASIATSGADRVQEVLDQQPEVREPAVPHRGPTRVRGAFAYRGVVFGYLPGQPVLHGIDLDVPPGKRIALVGLSGSGKTTMVKLIPRFYDVWSGSITIDGIDVRAYGLDALRRSVSLVLQDSVLFEGTIRDTIALGRPDAGDREIVDAARLAHIHDEIVSLPGGYAAPVREQGKNLSSGQRQRLAIARAILRDSPILVLDEPTANLDIEAEGVVMRALERLVVGRTVLMISHRLSTVGDVDEIVVLQRGRIVEQGSYAALKRARGVFAECSRSSAATPPTGRLVATSAGTSRRRPRPTGCSSHLMPGHRGRHSTAAGGTGTDRLGRTKTDGVCRSSRPGVRPLPLVRPSHEAISARLPARPSLQRTNSGGDENGVLLSLARSAAAGARPADP